LFYTNSDESIYLELNELTSLAAGLYPIPHLYSLPRGEQIAGDSLVFQKCAF
jgi:hypothetical protein